MSLGGRSIGAQVLPPPGEYLGDRVTGVDTQFGREPGRHPVEVAVPPPRDRVVADGHDLLVRRRQRGEEYHPVGGPGQQRGDRRWRPEAGRRAEVEVERRAGDDRERELGVGEADELDVGREPGRRPGDADGWFGEPAGGQFGDVVCRDETQARYAVRDLALLELDACGDRGRRRAQHLAGAGHGITGQGPLKIPSTALSRFS